MELSKDQNTVFNDYRAGLNIFMTGPGGSGKSTTIKEMCTDAIQREKVVCVTALTGVAANILGCGATTLHSWAGIGLGKGSVDILCRRVSKSKSKKEKWLNTDILIVDEVSMLSLDLFDKLNRIGSHVRRSSKPFGGIQVIFSGDFFQLPPVNDPYFCFESKDFKSVFDSFILLGSIFRQSSEEFKILLNNIRKGVISNKNIKLLNSRIGVECPEGIVPTVLCPIKRLVVEINNTKMEELDTKAYIYTRAVKTKIPLTKKEQKRETYIHKKRLILRLNISLIILCQRIA